jgi:hypothetical protein
MFHAQVSRIITNVSVAAVALLAIAVRPELSCAGESKQLVELYVLQAAFHAAATVHDPVNGDSPAAIDQRIRDMLALWTADGSLAGKYFGNGDPGDPATCPVPTAANPGTLCSFFKYVAGSFQPGNKWVSLSPAYKTHFEIDDNTATGYSECHYFDVSVDPATGNPRWQAKAHLPWDVNLEKVEGKWLLSRINPVPPIGIPVP